MRIVWSGLNALHPHTSSPRNQHLRGLDIEAEARIGSIGDLAYATLGDAHVRKPKKNKDSCVNLLNITYIHVISHSFGTGYSLQKPPGKLRIFQYVEN